MRFIPPLDEAQLGALLASRICHDLISPIGAISNALELYDDDEAMKGEALDLIRASAENASVRLQFARLAFGASGVGNFEMNSDEVQAIAALYMGQEKAELSWRGEALSLSKIQAKLLLNLLLVANASLPRGGVIEVALAEKNFTLTSQGAISRLPPKFALLLAAQMSAETIDAHAIQFYYTVLLARLAEMELDCEEGEKRITLTAQVKLR